MYSKVIASAPASEGTKPLAHRRYERIAQLVAGGVMLHKALQQTLPPGCNSDKISARRRCVEILNRPEVAARLQYLRERNAQHSEFKREHAVDYLVSILQTPIGDIDENHPLCEGKRMGRNGTVFWMPSKLAALELLCRMMPGWLAPIRADMSASPEAVEMLRALRNGDEVPAPIDITPRHEHVTD